MAKFFSGGLFGAGVLLSGAGVGFLAQVFCYLAQVWVYLAQVFCYLAQVWVYLEQVFCYLVQVRFYCRSLRHCRA